MSLVKRSLVKREIRDKIKASEGIEALVKALLLSILDLLTRLWPASPSSFLVGLAEKLT